MTDFLETSLWPSLAVAAILYILDYSLTLVTARLYHARVKDTIALQGSFELNPLFEKDIDALRLVSPRFVVGLLVLLTMLALLWYLTVPDGGLPEAYAFVFGALVLLQATIQMRHLRNLVLFSTAFGPGGIRGHVEYPRKVILRTSAFEFLTYAGLFTLLFVLTSSWLVLGGAVTAFGVALKQFLLASRHRSRSGEAAQQGHEAVEPR